MSLKLAVLASGSGTNFQAMVDAVRRGALDADIRLVICNRPGAKVIERAKAAGIICAVMDHKLWPSREAYDLAVADAILKSGADTVALAGYMRMLTAGFLNAFPHRVVNVHPALLPSFPGIHGAADAQACMRNATPMANPPAAGIHPTCPASSARSMAGISNDHTDAAIITPAANPRNIR